MNSYFRSIITTIKNNIFVTFNKLHELMGIYIYIYKYFFLY